MNDPYGLLASGLPPEMAAQAMGLTRQQMVMQALLQQSQQGMQAPEVKGRFQGRISPLEGIAKVVQAFVAQKGMQDADKGAASLSERKQQSVTDALLKYEQTRAGTPEVPQPSADLGGGPGKPATPGDPRAAVMQAMTNPLLASNPMVGMDAKQLQPTTVGRSLMVPATGATVATDPAVAQEREAITAVAREKQAADQQFKGEQADATRAAREREIEMRLADARTAREDRNALARELAASRGDKPKLKPGERFTADGQSVEAIPGSSEWQKQSGLHSKDYQTLLAVDTKTDQAVKKIDHILAEENRSAFEMNFGGYNAYGTRLAPGATQDMAQKIESLKSDMKAAGLELIRSGGSIGSMTQQEWPVVQDMIDRIDPRMGEKAARDTFKNVSAYLDRVRSNAKATYDTEWGSTQFSKNKKAPESPNRRATDKPGAVIDFNALPP